MVNIPEKHGRSSKVVILFLNPDEGGVPDVLFLKHKPKKNAIKQKRGGCYSKTLMWGYPGGTVEDGESLKGTAIRETRDEIHIELTPEMLSDRLVVHTPVRPSKRDGYKDIQDTYFMTFLPWDTDIPDIGPNNDEIIEGERFPLDGLPLPDDSIPSAKNQLWGLVELLKLMTGKVQYADEWLEMTKRQIDPYIDKMW
jgi:ADP-ribose pyrophosphatase YjhB (NUDIX family)